MPPPLGRFRNQKADLNFPEANLAELYDQES
jgi:hypothetical protein